MSFFTPMNPILQRELGSIRYDRPNRAAIYPGPMFDFDFKEFEDPEAPVLCTIFCIWVLPEISDRLRSKVHGEMAAFEFLLAPGQKWSNGRFQLSRNVDRSSRNPLRMSLLRHLLGHLG